MVVKCQIMIPRHVGQGDVWKYSRGAYVRMDGRMALTGGRTGAMD